jgi:hypothetical protein
MIPSVISSTSPLSPKHLHPASQPKSRVSRRSVASMRHDRPIKVRTEKTSESASAPPHRVFPFGLKTHCVNFQVGEPGSLSTIFSF